MRKINTKGFAAVELILIIIVIAMIAGVGYYVFQSQKKTNQSLTNATNAQGEPQKSDKKSSTTSHMNMQAESTEKITELGVQFPNSDGLKDLTYKVINVDYNGLGSSPTAYLSTKALNTAEKGKCDISSASVSKGTVPPLGFLVKTTGQYPASATADNSTGTLVKQFPTYYIAYRSAGMSCFSETANMNTVSDLNKQLATALKSLSEIK